MLARTLRIGLATTFFAAAMALAGSVAVRAESIQKTCGDEWKAAKAAGTVEAGTTWPKFLGECRTRHANDAAAPAAPAATPTSAPAAAPAPAPAATPAAAPAPAAPAPAPARSATTAPPPAPATAAGATTPAAKSGGREAMLARERQCGARWKQIKGTASLPAGITTWPKYWSWCNTQLKSGQTI